MTSSLGVSLCTALMPWASRLLCHTCAWGTGMCVYTAHRGPLVTQTYRDEDGLIEQLGWRVKHVEEQSLLVQGRRETSECLPMPTPPGRGESQPPTTALGLVHTEIGNRGMSSARTELWDLTDSGTTLP